MAIPVLIVLAFMTVVGVSIYDYNAHPAHARAMAAAVKQEAAQGPQKVGEYVDSYGAHHDVYKATLDGKHCLVMEYAHSASLDCDWSAARKP